MWAVEEWIEEVRLLVEVLDGPGFQDVASVLERSLDLVIHTVSDRSGYSRTLGTAEVATLLNVTKRTVQQWCRDQTIDSRKVNGEWVVDEWTLLDRCCGTPASQAKGH